MKYSADLIKSEYLVQTANRLWHLWH